MSDFLGNIKDTVNTMGDKLADSVDSIKERAIPTAEKTKEQFVKMAKETKDAFDEKISAMKEVKPTIIEAKKSKIKILLPNGYVKTKLPKQSKDEDFFGKQTSLSRNILGISPIDWESSLLTLDKETIINLTRNSLDENQGLIEVETGITERGENYGYSIIKELLPDEPGAVYILRMNIGNEKDTINIQAFFIEGGITGMRDSIGLEYARRADLVEVSDSGITGWTADPYDPEYKNGKLKNLSEGPFLDAVFPDHPLSQARELLLALIKDQLIIGRTEKENHSDESVTDDSEKEGLSEDRKADLRKMILEGTPAFEKETICVEPEETKKISLDEQLNMAIAEYNAAYTILNDHGTNLFFLRERSMDALNNVEVLVNSIANHPKSFDTEISEINFEKTNFTSAKEYAEKELNAAQNAALGAGAGAGAGIAAASIAPTAAMWVATTFGTASTGTAIATLSGAAMQNAALAWLGGGAIAAGGGGMAAGGQVLLILAGPLGIGIAGVSLLASIALFTKKKLESNRSKLEEIEAVKTNTQTLKNLTEKIKCLIEKTSTIRNDVANNYTTCLCSYGKKYDSLDAKSQAELAALVNKAKSLSILLNEDIK